MRPSIPIWVAALGEKNVAMTAEVADGWIPMLFMPEKARDVWGASLDAGRAKRDPSLGPLQITVGGPLAIGEGDQVTALRELARPMVALYVGGMGAKGKNFYNDVVRRYGFEEEAETIQDLYLDGKKTEAEALVPDALLEATSLCGPESYVAERIAAFGEAGVTHLQVIPMPARRPAPGRPHRRGQGPDRVSWRLRPLLLGDQISLGQVERLQGQQGIQLVGHALDFVGVVVAPVEGQGQLLLHQRQRVLGRGGGVVHREQPGLHGLGRHELRPSLLRLCGERPQQVAGGRIAELGRPSCLGRHGLRRPASVDTPGSTPSRPGSPFLPLHFSCVHLFHFVSPGAPAPWASSSHCTTPVGRFDLPSARAHRVFSLPAATADGMADQSTGVVAAPRFARAGGGWLRPGSTRHR